VQYGGANGSDSAGRRLARVGDWYTIGVLLGGGIGIGLVLAGLLASTTRGLVVALVLAVGLTAALGLNFGWIEVGAAVIGAVVGVVAGWIVVQGALRRGGTRLGVAGLMAAGGVLVMLLSAIPAVGYAIAVAVPIYAARLRGRQPTRYAGLRTLDK
jgi:hypothetical protein